VYIATNPFVVMVVQGGRAWFWSVVSPGSTSWPVTGSTKIYWTQSLLGCKYCSRMMMIMMMISLLCWLICVICIFKLWMDGCIKLIHLLLLPPIKHHWNGVHYKYTHHIQSQIQIVPRFWWMPYWVKYGMWVITRSIQLWGSADIYTCGRWVVGLPAFFGGNLVQKHHNWK